VTRERGRQALSGANSVRRPAVFASVLPIASSRGCAALRGGTGFATKGDFVPAKRTGPNHQVGPGRLWPSLRTQRDRRAIS